MTNTEKIHGAYPGVPMPGIRSRVARYHNARVMFFAADKIEGARCKVRAEDDARRLPVERAFTRSRNRQIARNRLYVFRATQAWKAIGEGATDPLVLWIIANYPPGDWRHDEACTALSEMPCTREQFYALALESQWCSEFESAVEAAEEAGVL